MSNPSSSAPGPTVAPSNPRMPARPVSLIVVAFLFVVFAAFFFLVRHYYAPAPIAPDNAAAENLPKDLEWRATNVSRRAALSELKSEQTQRLETFGWVDQKAGLVRIPIDEAMKLTVEKYQR